VQLTIWPKTGNAYGGIFFAKTNIVLT